MQRLCEKCCFDEVQLNDHSENDSATWEQWEKVDGEVGGKIYKNWMKKQKGGLSWS